MRSAYDTLIAKGKAEGIAAKGVEVALAMLQRGYSVDEIALITGEPVATIEAIQQKHQL